MTTTTKALSSHATTKQQEAFLGLCFIFLSKKTIEAPQCQMKMLALCGPPSSPPKRSAYYSRFVASFVYDSFFLLYCRIKYENGCENVEPQTLMYVSMQIEASDICVPWQGTLRETQSNATCRRKRGNANGANS